MSKPKQIIEIDDKSDMDWGFSIVDEGELPTVHEAETECRIWKARTEQMYTMILPLLKNLLKSPEKDYIYWPNREEKIEEFHNKIKELIK